MKALAIAALLAACTTDTSTKATPVDLCGEPPPSPGFSAAYGSDGYARLPSEQMQSISTFMNDYDTWANCVLSIKD